MIEPEIEPVNASERINIKWIIAFSQRIGENYNVEVEVIFG